MAVPQAALDFLTANPNQWQAFKTKYGSLPAGFSPPAAPAAALDLITKDPSLAPQFEQKYGYAPATLKQAAPVADPVEAQEEPLPVAKSITDVPGNIADAYGQGGIKRVGELLVSPSTEEARTEAFRQGKPGAWGDVSALANRSLFRIGSGLTSLGELALRYTGLDKAADVVGGGRERYQRLEDSTMEALRPEVRKSIESQFVQRAADGDLQFGEGASDPWWWTGTAIDVGMQAAPGIGAAGKAGRMAYGARYAEALAKAGAQKASTRVATRYAEREATKAAAKAAAIAGGATEGYMAGSQASQDVQRTLGELDEETMMNYEPYRELRQDGLSHEAARSQVADTQALKAGLGVAVATGLTGAPLNSFIGRWAAAVPVASNRLASAAGGAALEAATEGVQEGSQQLIQNLSQSPITGQDPWEGVLESAITGAAVGGAMGGAIGGVAGPEAPGGSPKGASGRIIEKRVKDYNAARDNLANAQGSASDPNIQITKADLDEAREQYQQAHVALAQELLKSGKLDPKEQESVAAALKEAQATGIEVPETSTDVDESQLSKPDEAGSGQEASKPAAAGQGKTAKPSEVQPAEGKPAPELNETQAARLALLQKVANAEPVTGEELSTLVSEKLANVSRAGQPVMLPAGRRQRQQLEGIVTKAEEAKTAKPAEASAEAGKPKNGEAAKPKESDTSGYSEDEVRQAPQRVPKKALGRSEQQIDAARLAWRDLPADKKATSSIGRLGAEDYGTLERIASKKPIDPKEAKLLIDEGLIAPRGENDYSIRPRGRRELKEFRETRQTALERSYVPTVEGEKVTISDETKDRRKDNQATMAQQTRAAERATETAAKVNSKTNRAEREARDRKRRESEAAIVQRGDQNLAAELAKVQPQNEHMAEALLDARAKARKPKADENPPPLKPAPEVQAQPAQQQQAKLQTEPLPDNPYGKISEEPHGQKMRKLPPDEPGGKWHLASGALHIPFDTEAEADAVLKEFSTKPGFAMSTGRAKLRFRHFSNLNEKEVTLDPKHQGTGIPGAERRRGGQKVTSLYAEDHPDSLVEPGLKSKTEYSVEMSFRDLYDANDDPKGFIEEASEGGAFDMSEFESLVKRAGFKGYVTPKAEGILKGQARVFEPVKAKRKTPVAAHRMHTAMTDAPIGITRTREAVRKIVHHFGFPVKVVSSHMGYPAEVLNLPGVEKSEALFHTTPLGGDVYLNAGNTKSEYDAQVNAIHEIVGHYGLRAVLGERYVDVMRDIVRSFPEEVRAAAVRNKISLVGEDRDSVLSNHWLAAEELVAYATENVLGKDIDAKQSVYARVVSFIRDVLRRMGALSDFTVGDVEGLIYRSRDFVRSSRFKRVRELDRLARRAGQTHFTPNYTPLKTGQGLSGMPQNVQIPGNGPVSTGPFETARAVARTYMRRMGYAYNPATSYLKVNTERAKRIAAAFEAMEHAPQDPKVQAAYKALVQETLMQYGAIKESGLKVEFIAPGRADPYAASPRLATEDVRNNNHLWVFPTDSGFGSGDFDPKDNPLLQETEEYVGDRRLLANDVFRIVHDYFGHVKEGVGFRADGEENAWRQHAGMYTPLARQAMTTETRGQNSWVNFGPYGEQNQRATGEKTRFADQKIGLLPEEFWSLDEEAGDEMASAFSAQDRPAFSAPDLGKAGKFLTEDERATLRTKQAQKMVDMFDDLPSDAEMAAVALAGKAKRGWYKKSAQAISDVFGHDAPRFAALLAALSPQTSVESNLRNAIGVWTAWVKAGRPTTHGAIFKIMGENVEGTGGKTSVLPAWINNSVRSLTAEDPASLTLSGPKVNSFAANLRGETNEVTLDTWMANYALVEQKLFSAPQKSKGAIGGKSPGYLAYSARVRQAATRLTKMTGETWTPSEVQETVWSWAKALTELTESYGHLGSAREIVESKELTDEFINATPDFATLFASPAYAHSFASGGYGEQIGRLSEATLAGTEGQAPASVEVAGNEKHLSAAARRIDKLIDRRRAAAAETRQENAFSLGGVKTGGDKNLESFLSKIGAKPKTLKQRWQEATADLADRANVGLFDHFFGIKRAEQLAGVSAGDSGYISARLAAGASGLMRSVLERGHPVWDDGAPNVSGEKGFFDILKPLGDDVNTWLAWMVARRAERLHTEGREHLFSPDEITAAKKLGDNNPTFQAAAAEYAEFKTKILDFAEEAGIINGDTRHVWDNADHIPFYRLMENGEISVKGVGGGIGFVKNQIRKLKGGEQNLGDPLENIMKNWSNMLEASLKAHAARLTIDNLNGTGLVTTANVQPFTPTGIAQFKANFPQLALDLKAIGIDVDTLTPSAFRGVQSMLARAPEAENAISVWRDGKKESWNIQDPLLFRSLQAINPTAWSPWMKVLRAPKRLLTETVTLVPEFAVKNIWRDMWSVFTQGTTDKRAIPIVPLLDTAKGALEMLRKGKSAQSMAAGGASFEGTGFNEQDAAQAARRAARRGGITHGIIDTPMKGYLLYRDLLSAAENAHRVAVYNKSLAAGKSRKEALYEARDLMDFSLRGNSPLMRFLVETVPFLGARVAGLSTLGRRFVADPKGVALRGLLITAASIAYVAMNFEDDRYKGLTDDQKNNYWHFFDVLEKDDHIRIPKPFEVGTVFGTIPEVAMDTFLTNKGEPDANKQALQVVGHAFANTLDLSPKVAAVWPVFELAINKNTFTGAPILNLGDKGVLPQEQDSPSVRSTYRLIAQSMPDFAPEAFRSPKQLQHLGRGYMGGLQDYVFAVTDRIARAKMGEPEPAKADAGESLFFKSFYDVGPARNTKYMNTLYTVADQAEQVHRSLNKAQTPERFDEILGENEDLVVARKTFKSAVEKVTDMRKQQRSLQLTDMDPVEKKSVSNEIDQASNELARAVWDLRPGGKLSPSVASKLMGVSKKEQVKTLRDGGMPATAGLVESLPRTAPSNLNVQ